MALLKLNCCQFFSISMTRWVTCKISLKMRYFNYTYFWNWRKKHLDNCDVFFPNDYNNKVWQSSCFHIFMAALIRSFDILHTIFFQFYNHKYNMLPKSLLLSLPFQFWIWFWSVMSIKPWKGNSVFSSAVLTKKITKYWANR